MAQTIRAILLASAMAATLIGRRAADRSDDPELGKMSPDHIDHCGLVANE